MVSTIGSRLLNFMLSWMPNLILIMILAHILCRMALMGLRVNGAKAIM